MTAIDTDTDLSVIEALDFEAEVPCARCEFMDNPPNKATWYMLRSCGCQAQPYCGPCKGGAEEFMSAGRVRCRTCGAGSVTVRFEPIEP